MWCRPAWPSWAFRCCCWRPPRRGTARCCWWLASVCAGLGQGVAFRTVFNDVAGKVEPSHHAQDHQHGVRHHVPGQRGAGPGTGMGDGGVRAAGVGRRVCGAVQRGGFGARCTSPCVRRCSRAPAASSRQAGLLGQRPVVSLDVVEDEGCLGVAHHGVRRQVVQHPVPQVLGAGHGDVQQVVHGA